MPPESYEGYPARIVLLSNALAVSIYGIGVYVLAGVGLWLVVLYVLYCLWIESRILKKSCVNCHYYGKRCGLGKGRLCSLLLDRGVPDSLATKKVSWWDILPDFMVSILPLVAGIVQLARGWSWLLIALLAVLVLLSSVGNAVVRGRFLCRYCRQREIGCPAQKLFAGCEQ